MAGCAIYNFNLGTVLILLIKRFGKLGSKNGSFGIRWGGEYPLVLSLQLLVYFILFMLTTMLIIGFYLLS